MTEHAAFLVFGLLAIVGVLVALARALRVAYPVVMVLGGAVLALTPFVPAVRVPPDLILLVFLPPILYEAAFFSSPRDFFRNVYSIGSLAIGVTLITVVTIAWLAHLILDLPWSAAFVLGAIVAPTDPVSATAVAGKLDAPRQLVVILEGESLINDGTAIVLYHIALGVVASGVFSLSGAFLEFARYVFGGIAIGFATGWIVRHLRRRVADRRVEIIVSLLSSYAAFLPAHELGSSGVLAAVVAGLYLGWHSPELTTPRARLQLLEIWEILPFLLNSLLFLLIGLQLPAIFNEIEDLPTRVLVANAGLISLAVIASRLFWVFPFAFATRRRHPGVPDQAPYQSWRQVVAVGWSGMRGGVSLALALAVPFTTATGDPFPGRNVILFVTFCVILATLVPQGVTLPWLLRGLSLSEGGGPQKREENEARLRTAEAALGRLEELAGEEWVDDVIADPLRRYYEGQRRRFAARTGEETDDGEVNFEARSRASRRLRREVIGAERAALLQLRNSGRISDGVRRKVERIMDLEETRLGM